MVQMQIQIQIQTTSHDECNVYSLHNNNHNDVVPCRAIYI